MRDPAGFGQLSRLRRRKHDAQVQEAGQETRIERLQSDLFGFKDRTTIQNHSNGFMLTVCFHPQFLQSFFWAFTETVATLLLLGPSHPSCLRFRWPVVIAGHCSPSVHQRTCLPCLYLKARYISVHHCSYIIWHIGSTGSSGQYTVP